MKAAVIKTSLLFSASFFLIVLSAPAQLPVKKYEKEWKRVTELIDKGLPKSALAEVKKIYTLAQNQKQDAQVIKSLMYMISLQRENREKNAVLSITELEKELKVRKGSAAAILNSLLAEIYWGYYQSQRWKIYNRTKTENFSKTDLTTWDAEDFHKRISQLYLLSIQEETLLQQTKLTAFDELIQKGNMRHLRPTLFDLLAHRALSYFENDERDIRKPAYAFEINQAAAFAPAFSFAKEHFSTKDSLSLQHKALQLYQKILAFHQHDTKPDALLDADLLRLQFVKNHSTHPDKDVLYMDALQQICSRYGQLPAAAQAWYLVASWHRARANEYKPLGDTTYRFSQVKAKEICDKVLQQKDSSEGKINCQNLLQEIRKQSFRFSIEKVNIPNQPFRTLVHYKNTNQLWFRIIKSSEALKKILENQYDEKFWPALTAARAEKMWTQSLPDTKDFQEHSTEIKIDGLPSGEYVLLASGNAGFSDKNTVLGARYFYVSAISYVQQQTDFFVLHRDSGLPLENASVQIWDQRYDYNISKYIREKGPSYHTDANGYFKMERKDKKENRYGTYFLVDISHNNDRLFMNDNLYDSYYDNQTTDKTGSDISVHLFTDRSIYRPGQTLYFKGIVLTKSKSDHTGSVQAGYATSIILRNANYQNMDTIHVTTNEYGSFQGKFQLPQSGMNGPFMLMTLNEAGSTNFRVEEYKRPKFYVSYEPVKGAYKVQDNITVTGNAKGYAGNNIDGALVTYRVVRQPRFIYSWYFWRWWQPPSEEMEIAHGETKTDQNGKFSITFKAIPDLKIDKKFDPLFDFTIYADVTDLNGETRSGEQSITVSYKAVMLSAIVPVSLPADSLKQMNIFTRNMNGEHEPSMLTVSISRLKEEKRLIRNRYWERPDQFVMTREEYIRYFPNDEYANESDFRNWEKGEQVFSKSDSAKKDGTWPVLGTWTPGFYVIEISAADKNGERINDIRFIELFDEKSSQLSRPAYLWTGMMNTVVDPGQTAKVELGTGAENLFVVQQISKGKARATTGSYSFIRLHNQKQTFSFPASEADRGGFGINWMFIRHNRLHQMNQLINVPWTNKQLKIEYSTFREKTLPGSEEKWKVKITGFRKEKVAAELLAAMYDASLDQFYHHSWSEPYIWPYFYNSRIWNGTQNFNQLHSYHKYLYDQVSAYVDKRYDYLFGTMNGFGSQNGYGMRRAMKDGAPAGQPEAEMTTGAPVPVSENKEMAEEISADGLVSKKVGKDEDGIIDDMEKKKKEPSPGEVKVRKNFNETAFFFPELRTDSTGAVEFSFTMPEALTRWKFMTLAHTKEAAFGSSTKEIVTQKELMVQPNAPRFLREGDKMEFSCKIVNLTEKEMTGTAEFQLFDAATGEAVDGWFHNSIPNQYFTVKAGQSEAVKFPIDIPYQFNKALGWRIIAKSGSYSDGEENTLPVLTNRMLVTETLPMPVRGTGTKKFSFDKLLNSGKSESLQHYRLTVEYTSSPAWYAVQALPYLMEYPYECAEQTWNRYYANSLAAMIANSSPKIKEVFKKWQSANPPAGSEGAFLSNLQKNQELKSVLLEETPWVLQAKNEAEQKKNIALLFDMIRMSEQLQNAYEKLKQMQSSNGGFVWFSGGPDDRYITQYIVTGIGHLKKLKAIAPGQDGYLKAILSRAIPYLDRKIKEDYDDLLKYKTNLNTYTPGYTTIQYLYMRSFFPEYEMAATSKKAYDYFRRRMQLTWVGQNKYMQGMAALALYRTADTKTPAAILKSLKETSISNEELGMYWKDQRAGWFWYEAPIETHSLLIEAFQEAGTDTKTVDDLKTWLLKNKQTHNWKTTKATSEACYALLLQGSDWLTNQPTVEINAGSALIKTTGEEEAGTGYFKKIIEGRQVKPEMGDISVTISSNNNQQPVSWGALYWQYFEDLDKISTAATPLSLSKKLFIEKNTDRGPVISPVQDGSVIQVGDKIKVRIELRADRDMEYVHMKDMRASALEPVNVLSRYKWQGGLGYYESTKDASTNFFFSYLRKGTYVFEYTLFATHAGNFSNGITSIQCMYAPEFSSHSEGVRITVE